MKQSAVTKERVESLIERSFDARHSQPAVGLALAKEAVVLAGRLGEAELIAKAWAYLGNALRVRNDLRASEGAFAVAWARLPASAARTLRVRIYELHASLLESIGSWDKAEEALGHALEIHRRLGQKARLAACLVQRANVRGHAGHLAHAVRDLRAAINLIDPESSPELAHAALHNLCWFYVDLGLPREAQKIALERSTAPMTGDPLLALRTRWLHARIFSGLGAGDIAVAELSEVMDEFASKGLPFEAALAGLELAALQAPAVAAATLEKVLPLFDVLGVEREAEAARLLLYGASNAECIRQIVPAVVLALKTMPPGYTPRRQGRS